MKIKKVELTKSQALSILVKLAIEIMPKTYPGFKITREYIENMTPEQKRTLIDTLGQERYKEMLWKAMSLSDEDVEREMQEKEKEEEERRKKEMENKSNTPPGIAHPVHDGSILRKDVNTEYIELIRDINKKKTNQESPQQQPIDDDTKTVPMNKDFLIRKDPKSNKKPKVLKLSPDEGIKPITNKLKLNWLERFVSDQ
jgi:hypothetical protein